MTIVLKAQVIGVPCYHLGKRVVHKDISLVFNPIRETVLGLSWPILADWYQTIKILSLFIYHLKRRKEGEAYILTMDFMRA